VGITQEDYCSRICGGKCCRVEADNYTCRHLTDDCKCAIYARRFAPEMGDFEVVDLYSAPSKSGIGIKQVVCGRVKKQIEMGISPKHLIERCCIAHPELLEKE